MLQVRRRERVESSPKAGLDQAWTEWQVVDGRRVISRHGTEAEAIKALAHWIKVKQAA